MQQQPLVTVLMPVFNAEKFLHDSIPSILQQTFTAFEFLIIDDGSSDNSIAIIESYADERIRLVKNDTNLGITATLNKGLQLASCDLVARMDADDISYPYRLQMQYNYLTVHKDVVMLSAWVRHVNEDKVCVSTETPEPEVIYYNLTFTCFIYHPTVMYRREAILTLGGYTVPYSEDFELWWQIIRHYKIATLPQYVLDYRLSSQSLHQVLKKKEYDEDQHNQVRRNIAYYMGYETKLSFAQIEACRYYFDPLLEEGNINSICATLTEMKKIAEAIEITPNVNCIPFEVRRAGAIHRRHILIHCIRKLSRKKSLLLVYKTGAWRLYAFLLYQFLKEKIIKPKPEVMQ